jgi:hypothetical protein
MVRFLRRESGLADALILATGAGGFQGKKNKEPRI